MTIKAIDAATVKRWMDSGESVVVDVREPAEYAVESAFQKNLFLPCREITG